MANRTYVVGLRLALTAIAKYVQKYEKQLRQNMGDGPYAALQFVLDLVAVCLVIIETGSTPNGDWIAPEAALTSANITQINSAISAFNARTGQGA